MAHGKDKYYWSQLRAALTAGQWSSPSPAKTPKGIALSWSELLRKFNKHAKGFKEVAEVASQTQALTLLLDANAAEIIQNDGESDGHLALGTECMLPEERIEEATGGFEVLIKLEASNFDSLQLALSYYAYALGRPAKCLAYLSKVPDLSDVQSHIPSNPATIRSNTSTLMVPPSTDTSLSRTTSFISADSGVSVADINDGRAWAMTETIRSICLQGMSHEKLSPAEPEIALKAYCTVQPLLAIVLFEIPLPANTIPAGVETGAGKLDFSSFTRFRELWLWIERLLWRAIILASLTCKLDEGEDGMLWKLLANYRRCSVYWPTKFNMEHRSTVAVLHLRALVLRARLSGSARGLDVDKPPPWLNDARQVIHEYRAILSVRTRFPRAGERNVKVEDFVDLCVAIWEASGAIGDQASWVIDILWWATRLTFNSYRIFRHMTRLFYVSGDTQLARRTLRLYVQVVGKAWEAGGVGVGVDADTDQHWVETLVQGARMLCRLAGPNGVDDAREAGTLIEKAKTRLDMNDKELVASVGLAEGIWSSVMALVEHEPRTRPSRLAYSLAQLVASIETFPTPSAYYHLAIALARSGPHQDLDQAIANASSALEGASGDIRYWHLLGLLLTANGKWKEAKGILEIGTGIGEKGDESDDGHGDEGDTDTVGATRGLTVSGLANSEVNRHIELPELEKSRPQSILLLEKGCTMVPPPATLLQVLPDCPSPSTQDAFERALQLRMTQLALTECVEGAEGAGLKWVEVFGWVAERKGLVSEQQRVSLDTRVSETLQPSDYLHINTQFSEGHHTEVRHSSEKQTIHQDTLNGINGVTVEAPPITVTPPTPANTKSHFLASEKRSPSMDQESSTGKKVQQMLKSRVHKSHARITTISRKIGHGMVRNGGASLRRSISAPDFHTLLQHKPYQASSIHSRKRLNFMRPQERSPSESPPPPPPAPSPGRKEIKWNNRVLKENRLLSDLWLMSAATFRRHGKIEQAKAAIQEGEVKDEDNPAVWVQLGLYYKALGHGRLAIDAFHKALFISPDDVSAVIHLCRMYLSPFRSSNSSQNNPSDIDPDNVDLATGMLSYCVKGAAWDVPEAWYFLAKGYGLQGRKDKEREALALALSLSEQRCIREIGTAVGWCL